MNYTENNELKRIDPSEDSGFVVPEGYFEVMKSEIDQKIGASNIRSLRSRKSWIYSVAAAVFLLLGVVGLIYRMSEQESQMGQKGFQISGIAMDSNRQMSDGDQNNSLPTTNVASADITPESQDIIDNQWIETAEDLNLSDEEFLELAELTDL